jgi:hypothetical protein
VPWAVSITHQMRRIEGPSAPLADARLVLGAVFVLEFIIPLMIWQAAARVGWVAPGWRLSRCTATGFTASGVAQRRPRAPARNETLTTGARRPF